MNSSEAAKTEQGNEKETESPATKLRRAHPAAGPHRVVVSLNPLAPNTGLRHRVNREIADRADEAPGRDDKDVGVRSFSCGVARKKNSLRWLGVRGIFTRIPQPDLFESVRLKGCTRARMVLPCLRLVQQEVV